MSTKHRILSSSNSHTSLESCQRTSESDCKGGRTRFYGEHIANGSAFTGWRGPFCSVHCYLKHYPTYQCVDCASDVRCDAVSDSWDGPDGLVVRCAACVERVEREAHA